MGNLNRKLGQRKRRANETIAGAIVDLIVFVLKWTIFLPITLIILIVRMGKK